MESLSRPFGLAELVCAYSCISRNVHTFFSQAQKHLLFRELIAKFCLSWTAHRHLQVCNFVKT